MKSNSSPTDWLKWLKSGDESLVAQARLALGGTHPTDDVDLAPLSEALDEGDDTVTFWALAALIGLGPKASMLLPRICSLAISGSTTGIRQACATAIASIAPEARVGVTTLLRLLGDASPTVRREALQALCKMTPLADTDLAAIRAARNDPDPNVARWSKIAIRNIRATSRDNAPG